MLLSNILTSTKLFHSNSYRLIRRTICAHASVPTQTYSKKQQSFCITVFTCMLKRTIHKARFNVVHTNVLHRRRRRRRSSSSQPDWYLFLSQAVRNLRRLKWKVFSHRCCVPKLFYCFEIVSLRPYHIYSFVLSLLWSGWFQNSAYLLYVYSCMCVWTLLDAVRDFRSFFVYGCMSARRW